MNATPAICPVCGELVIALAFPTDDHVLDVPNHPDLSWPWLTCPMSDKPMPRLWDADRHNL